ncbi:MAG: hypothetical protein AAF337_08425 [Pseudomonadota bacterium]
MSRKLIVLTTTLTCIAVPSAFAQDAPITDEELRAEVRAIVEATKAENDLIREDIAPLREEVRTLAAEDFDAARSEIQPIVDTARTEQRRLTEEERTSVRTSLETLKANVETAAPEQVEAIQLARSDIRANRSEAREDIRAILPEDARAPRSMRERVNARQDRRAFRPGRN